LEKESNFVATIDDVYKNKDSFKISALDFAKKHDWKIISKQLIDNFEKLFN